MRRWVVLAAALLALGGLFWLQRGAREAGSGVRGEHGAASREDAGGASELVSPLLFESGEGVVSRERAPSRKRTSSAPLKGARTRAIIRGQLIDADSGAPLALSLIVRLRTGDLLTRQETVRCRPDGSFESTELFPRGFFLAQVLRPAGDPAVEREGYLDPEKDKVWDVSVPWPDFARGRALERSGEPLAGVILTLPPGNGGAEPVWAESDESGAFFLGDVATGTVRLGIAFGFGRAEHDLVLVQGPNELGDLLLPFEPPAGEISGVLHSGATTRAAPRALLFLRDQASGRVAMGTGHPVQESPDTARFAFPDVPHGNYVLSIAGLDGERWEPSELEVSPPRDDLVFRVAAGGRRFVLDVRLPHGRQDPFGMVQVQVLVRVRGVWSLDRHAFLREDVERWVALGSGLRPDAGVCPPDVERDVARLTRGFSQAFLFVQSSGEIDFQPSLGAVRGGPLGGVSVRADGREVARSGDDGLALVELDHEPTVMDFNRVGWRVRSVTKRRFVSLVAMMQD